MTAEKIKDKYIGEVAQNYEARRASGDKWAKEQVAMEGLLKTLAQGSSVLDIPVGTGRFVEMYKKHDLHPTGIDVSDDMLSQAQEKATENDCQMNFEIADIRNIPRDNSTFDVVICIRFLNWVSEDELRKILKELSRVSRKDVFIGVRTYAPIRCASILHALKNTRSALKELKKRVKKSKATTIHKQKSLEAAIEDSKLSIHQNTLIERGYDLSIYQFYHLKKNA